MILEIILIVQIFSKLLKLYILFGIELENDSIYAGKSLDALVKADFVVFHLLKTMYFLDVADVIFYCFYMKTLVLNNMSGIWQSFDPLFIDYEVSLDEALSDLASSEINGFNYIDSINILSEIKSFINENCTLSWNLMLLII
jgi:hypothetical protein